MKKVYRLVKHIGKLTLLHGVAENAPSTIIHLTNMYVLAQKYQTNETCQKYLKSNMNNDTRGIHYDFNEHEIIIIDDIAFINENTNETIN